MRVPLTMAGGPMCAALDLAAVVGALAAEGTGRMKSKHES